MLYILGEAALRTALLAGILQCILSLLRVRRTRLLLAAWTVVLATSLAMPLLLRSSPVLIPVDDTVPRALFGSATELMQHPLMQESARAASIETHALPSIEVWLEILYIVIASGLGLRTLFGVGLSLKVIARATPTYSEWAMGLRVRLSREVAGPVTIASTIVLPTDFDDWPAETRQAVMAHEHGHVARRDYAMLVISQLNRAVFWFSPISWWLHRRLVVLAELVSDDQAIEVTRDRIGYAEILIEMAQRPGRRTQGPSMASFATLPLRINRILFDEVTPSQVGKLQWGTATLGVAAASLMVANFVPSVVLMPVATYPSNLGIREAEVGKATQEALPSVSLLPEKPLKPKVFIPRSIAPSVTRTQQARVAAGPRPTVQAPTKTMLSPPINSAEQVTKTVSVRQSRYAPPTPSVVDQKETGVQSEDTKNNVAATGNSVGKANEILYPRQMTDIPLRANLERMNGSTCVGTVVVGMRAYHQSEGILQPNVTAGQIIPAKAQFFRQGDGSSWVRFGSFGRPALDLRVQPTRTGVTWTGEYGITYAVQEAGSNHFVGLAARIANDSAALSFICKK